MLLRVMLLCITPFIVAPAFAQNIPTGDDLADHQGQNGYNSIVDGHPASPGDPQFDLLSGTDFDGTGYMEAAVEYTPMDSPFLRDMLLVVTVPRLNLGSPEAGFEQSVGLAWQQRWTYEQGGWPTVSTEIAASADSDLTDVVATLIVAKNVGRGVLYGNAFVESISHGEATPGAALGYKHPLNSNVHAIGGMVVRDDDLYVLELSFEYAAAGWTVGPGVALALPAGDLETNNLNAGAFITHTP